MQYDLKAQKMKPKFVRYRKPGQRKIVFTPTLPRGR
jgi:hypothetical protein